MKCPIHRLEYHEQQCPMCAMAREARGRILRITEALEFYYYFIKGYEGRADLVRWYAEREFGKQWTARQMMDRKKWADNVLKAHTQKELK